MTASGLDTRDRTDADLLAAHVAGDAAAFGELFARHSDRLWTLALRTTGNPADAADALQDALVSAFRRAGTFRGDAAVTTWLHRIVVNACLDRLRRLRTRRTAELPGDDSPQVAALEAPDPLEARERQVLVHDALNQVSADQRAAIVLVDMEGYSVEDAARILGCAPGTVKSRCSRGRAKLATLLRDLLEDG